MTQIEAYKYWVKSAKDNQQVAKDNFKLNHYSWSLFFWHLVIEKTLKGITTKNGNIPLPVHDLLKLAKVAKIKLSQAQTDQLKEITTFNIEARYDDYKLSFHKKATKNYAQKWNKICEGIYTWLLNQI